MTAQSRLSVRISAEVVPQSYNRPLATSDARKGACQRVSVPVSRNRCAAGSRGRTRSCPGLEDPQLTATGDGRFRHGADTVEASSSSPVMKCELRRVRPFRTRPDAVGLNNSKPRRFEFCYAFRPGSSVSLLPIARDEERPSHAYSGASTWVCLGSAPHTWISTTGESREK